jgi:hypothetical protein
LPRASWHLSTELKISSTPSACWASLIYIFTSMGALVMRQYLSGIRDECELTFDQPRWLRWSPSVALEIIELLPMREIRLNWHTVLESTKLKATCCVIAVVTVGTSDWAGKRCLTGSIHCNQVNWHTRAPLISQDVLHRWEAWPMVVCGWWLRKNKIPAPPIRKPSTWSNNPSGEHSLESGGGDDLSQNSFYLTIFHSFRSNRRIFAFVDELMKWRRWLQLSLHAIHPSHGHVTAAQILQYQPVHLPAMVVWVCIGTSRAVAWGR